MNYARILPKLFVGSHPKDANDVEALRKLDVTAVLNLQTDEDMKRLGVAWDSLRASYDANRIDVSRVPVRDFDVEDLEARLPACVGELRRLLNGGATVYLHCTAGAGRAPNTAIAYLAWECGWGIDRAVQYVRRHRECSPPVDTIVRAFGRRDET